MKKYLGISGITKPSEVAFLKEQWESFNNQQFNLYLGYLLNIKQLYKDYPSGNPRNIDLKHYNDLLQYYSFNMRKIFHIYSTSPNTLFDDINFFISSYWNDVFLFDGFQFNIEGLLDKEVEKIRNEWNFRIILQMNQFNIRYIEQINYELYDHILIDFSRGNGLKGSDLRNGLYHKIISRIQKQKPTCSIAVAGGIDADSIYTYMSEFPDCSFDAESSLRTPDNKALDFALVEKYLKNALIPPYYLISNS